MMYLPYGWRDGKLVSISEVERGLACACVCPACRAPLVAKKGVSKAHHFSHYQVAECSGGLETALHLRAKEILLEARRLVLPPVLMDNSGEVLFPRCIFGFDRVVAERRVGRVIPDLAVIAGERRLLVEVAVTHRVDPVKRRRLVQLGYAALEVDLAYLVTASRSGGFDDDAFRRALLFGVDKKKWLFNPRKQALQVELRGQARRRTVRRTRGRDGGFYYVVQPCPQRKRWYFNRGQSIPYASVTGDCLHCPFALEIAYHTTIRAFREVPTEPREVVCWGHDPGLWKKLKQGGS